MSLWVNTELDQTIELGDWFNLRKAFAEMDHLAGMDNYPELFGVVEAIELQEDVDEQWLSTVMSQAKEFLTKYEDKLSGDAVWILQSLVNGPD